MNEENPNNLNNNVQSPNGQVPNGQIPNEQMPNQQGQNFQEPNPYAQSYDPSMQNLNEQPFMQNPPMNQNTYTIDKRGNVTGGQNAGQNNVQYQVQSKKAGPVKKHGMSVITTLILLVLIAAVVLGGHFVYKQVTAPANRVRNTTEAANNIASGVNTKSDKLKVGAYITYSPDVVDAYTVKAEYTGQEKVSTISQNKNMHWRIFKVEDDYIEIIATVPTEEGLTLSGAMGYNNGVYLLNDICKTLYSNNSLNAVGRSITIEDITSKIPEDTIKSAGYEAVANTYKTYTGANSYYPELYANENGSGIGNAVKYIDHESLKENATNEGANDLNNINVETEVVADVKTNGCEQSDSYYSNPLSESPSNKGYKVAANQQFIATHTAFTSNVTTCFSNEAYGPMFYGTQRKYWLASRYVNCAYNDMANFGLRTVNANTLEIVKMFDSDGSSFTVSYSVLPIVTIKNVRVASGIGTAKDPIVLEN